MTNGVLLIDGSNLGYACAATRKLTANGRETQGIYGILRMLRPLVSTYSMLTPIVLWDGVSWRMKAFPEYKATRNKEPETTAEKKLAADRASYKSQMAEIKQAVGLLGIRQISALNLEADDLAGILVRKFLADGKKVVLVSGDKDWVQLVQPGVGWFDVINDNRLYANNLTQRLGYRPAHSKIDPKTGATKKVPGQIGIFDGTTIPGWIGVPSGRAWLEMKALMGDTSDDIPGVGGIGEKGALDLVVEYGSVFNFLNATIDHSKIPAKFAALADDAKKQELFRRNMDLMDLNSPLIPEPINFTLATKVFDKTELEKFCRDLAFQSILTDFDRWCAPFEPATKAAA